MMDRGDRRRLLALIILQAIRDARGRGKWARDGLAWLRANGCYYLGKLGCSTVGIKWSSDELEHIAMILEGYEEGD